MHKVIMTGVLGKKIGIESEGDPNSRLRQSLIDLKGMVHQSLWGWQL
jgi:hypothetical protein